ncbi:MAG: Pyrrolo-quinoline quinone [Armatimonadetes bacterium]|jgi:outer membrane protein assembly factor BamB|nr:Pyrrolo-quinoline quinone [Armatimonadota bacterium]
MQPLILAALLLAAAPSAGRVWPAFRGHGDSRSAARNVPVRWSAEENVRWRADLAGYGQSSPVVWNDRVFVTSIAGEQQDRLLARCLDLNSGKTLWEREFKGSQGVKTSDYVSKAAPTPAVDADRVYLFFESGDLMALTHAGEPVWQRSLVREFGAIKSNHGLGSSPILTGNGLALLVAHDAGAYLLMADPATGKTRWKRDHPFGAGWTTPLAASHQGQKFILVSSSGRVDAFDLASGEPLWFVEGLKGNTVPSPSVAGDLVVIGASERNSTLAIRLGGKGNVTETHVAWRQPEIVCSFGSPLVYDGRIYLTNKTGIAYCLDVLTGKPLWEARLPAGAWASASAVEGRVYFFDTAGNAMVVKAGATLEKVAENQIQIEGRVYGTAFVDDALLLRTGNRLYRIGTPKP